MIYVKSLLFGVFAAVVGLVVWVVGQLAVGLVWLWLQTPQGAGGLGAVSGSLSTAVLVGALLPFMAGTAWMYRRLQRRSRGR